jgi:dGTPase
MIATTQENLQLHNPQSYDDVRHAKSAYVAFSLKGGQENLALKDFLYKNMYRHHKVLNMSFRAKTVIQDLFNAYFNKPNIMSFDNLSDSVKYDKKELAVFVADFISGMTDKFALEEHHKLFELTAGKL